MGMITISDSLKKAIKKHLRPEHFNELEMLHIQAMRKCDKAVIAIERHLIANGRRKDVEANYMKFYGQLPDKLLSEQADEKWSKEDS